MKKAIWIKYYEQGLFKHELTFEDADKKIGLRANELSNYGIKMGDRVVVQLPNSPVAAITYLAIYRLKAIAVPVSILEDNDRLNYIISDSGSSAIINDKGVQIINNKNRKNEPTRCVVSTIIYTSGTTGIPKGVCLSWNNWAVNAKSLIKHHNLDSKTIFASPLLLTHCNAHGLAMISTYIARCKWILFDKTPLNLLEIISKEKVNMLSIVPPILYSLYNLNKNWKPYKEFKYILTAAAPLSPDLLTMVMDDWKIKVVQGYGLSEGTNFFSTLPIDLGSELYKKIMFPLPSVGVAISGVKIKIGKGDKEGEVGELSVCSKSNFNGYWGKDEIKHKEWIDTGDIGYYKKIKGHRYYYLKGRLKEIINRGGEKISPIEVEHELYNVGLGGEFAVVSIPSEKYGEDVGLACCQESDFSIIKNIPKYRRPKKIFILNNLFYTHTGKLQRKKISDFCNSGNAKVVIEESSIE